MATATPDNLTHVSGEVKNYTFNWASWLASGETVDTSNITISGSGLTISSQSNTTTSATCTLTGGTSGQRYTLTSRITATDSQAGICQVAIICEGQSG